MGKVHPGINDLYTWCINNGELGKRVLREWVGKDGDGNKIDIHQVPKCTARKYKWRCSICKSEWVTSAHSRVTGHNCPYCAGAKVNETNSLYTWCLNNGEQGKKVLEEWVGEDENGNKIGIKEISFQSYKKYKWKCRVCKSEWATSAYSRVISGYNCPYCSGAKVNETNCLNTWCLNNGERGQQLLKEWVGEDENGNKIDIDKISKGAVKKVKWRCSICKSEWTISVHNRVIGYNCPYCSGAKVNETNSLYTWCINNGEWGKRLIDEWVGEDEDHNKVSIHEVTRGSAKRVYWKCKYHGDIFIERIYDRTHKKSACKHCRGELMGNLRIQKQLEKGNSLLNWCKEHGKFGQILQSEFTGVDIDGNKVEMSKITYASGTKLKWRCEKGHEFYQSPAARTSNYLGCPHCKVIGTSLPEQFIYWCFKQIWNDAESRCHVLKTVENPRGIEFDIGIPSIRLCIEYSPTKWHEGKEWRDNYKKELCRINNVRLITIVSYEPGYLFDEEADDTYYVKDGAKQEELVKIIDEILKQYGHSIQEIDTDLAYENAYKYSRTTLEAGKSLKDVYPELAKEYNEKLNPYGIQSIAPHSTLEVYWTCHKCGYGQNGEWKVRVGSRTRIKGGTGCPRCGWNWKRQDYNDRAECKRIIEGFNDLQSQEPELAKEYSVKNELKANEIRRRSSKKVLWECPKCGHGKNGEWKVSVNCRTANGGTSCPKCGWNWAKQEYTDRSKNTRIIEGLNDLQSQEPELAKEYSIKNKLKANEVRSKSGKEVLWECPNCGYGKNGEWEGKRQIHPAQKRATALKRISAAAHTSYVVRQDSGALAGSSGTAQPSTVRSSVGVVSKTQVR